MSDNAYNMIAGKIIAQQELVVGSLAWLEADKVSGITIKDHMVEVAGDGKQILADLVAQYSRLFGQASVEVCKDAIKPISGQVDKSLLPDVLTA